MLFHKVLISFRRQVPGFEVSDQVVMRMNIVADVDVEDLQPVPDILYPEAFAEIHEYFILAVLGEEFMEEVVGREICS